MKLAFTLGALSLLLPYAGNTQVLATPSQVITPVIQQAPSHLETLRERARKAKTNIENVRKNDLTSIIYDTASSIKAPLFKVPAAKRILGTTGQIVISEITTPDGFLAVEREWIFIGNKEDSRYFQSSNFTHIDAKFLKALDRWRYIVKVKATLDELSLIRDNLPAELQSQVGRNHIYLSQQKQHVSETLMHKKGNASPTCQSPLRVGMVDSDIVEKHPMLSHLTIKQMTFSPEQTENGSEHGTAVASLLAQKLPLNSRLFNASVFYTRSSVSQGATLSSLIDGLDYLASQSVETINMSLAGPDNPVLAKTMTYLTHQGIQIIAAVGNEGPASLPLYPAAYKETIGVSAVDESGGIYRWANQGDYVDFAALGVSIPAAHPNGATIRQSGTSMAAPQVAATYACYLQRQKSRMAALTLLQKNAIDAGEPGRDSVYGFGILH